MHFFSLPPPTILKIFSLKIHEMVIKIVCVCVVWCVCVCFFFAPNWSQNVPNFFHFQIELNFDMLNKWFQRKKIQNLKYHYLKASIFATGWSSLIILPTHSI